MNLKEQVNLFVYELAMQVMEYGQSKGWAMLHPISMTELTHVIKICYLMENSQNLFQMSRGREAIVCNLNRQIEEYLLLYHVEPVVKKEPENGNLEEEKKQQNIDVNLNWWIAKEIPLKDERLRIYLKIYASCLLQPRDCKVVLFFRRLLFYSEFQLLKTGMKSLTSEIMQQQNELQKQLEIRENADIFNEWIVNIEQEVTEPEKTEILFAYYRKYCNKNEIKGITSVKAFRFIEDTYLTGKRNWKNQEAELARMNEKNF